MFAVERVQCFELCPPLVALFDKETAANVHAGISGGTLVSSLARKHVKEVSGMVCGWEGMLDGCCGHFL